jgi:phenylalanyl-tRNA synthetase alpha subunit
MISTALTLIAATLSMQASDTTRAAREGFTRCLRTFVESSAHASKTLEQFNAEFPQACATQQAAFRQAIIARDMSSRSTRAGAEEAANLEVEDARANFNDLFQMSIPPQQTAAAPAAPAAAAAAAPAHPTVAAQPASHTTGPAAQPAAQPH